MRGLRRKIREPSAEERVGAICRYGGGGGTQSGSGMSSAVGIERARVYACTYACTHTGVGARVHTGTHAHTWIIEIYTHTHIYVYTVVRSRFHTVESSA